MAIVTLIRDKLPTGISFPVGKQLIESQVDSSSVGDAALLYIYTSSWQHQHYDPLRDERDEYVVLMLQKNFPFLRVKNSLLEKRYTEASVSFNWYFTLFPVRSEYRARVKEAFALHGQQVMKQATTNLSEPKRGRSMVTYFQSDNRFGFLDEYFLP